MKKIVFTLIVAFITIGSFAQKKDAPSDNAIKQMMEVKKGMVAVNSLIDDFAGKITTNKVADFKKEMETYKKAMLTKAVKTFKEDYSAKEIEFIYKECTSDIIDYSDLTNDFFAKWRRLKGEYFGKAKETYFKYE